MARPPAAKPSQKTKMFQVTRGYRIGGNDGKIKEGGDEIELTRDQALYHQKLGSITVLVPEFEDDDETDTPKTGAGSKADGAGAASADAASNGDDAPKKRKLR